MSRRTILFLFGSFFLIQFIFFSYLVHKDIFNQIDFNSTIRLQDHITSRVDTLFSFFSEIGKIEIMTIILVILLLFSKKYIAGFMTLGMYLAFHLIEIYGKFFVNHPPPPQFMLRTKHIIDFPQFHVRTENSFPSGHAGRTLFLSTILFIMIWNSKRLTLGLKIIFTSIILLFDASMLVSRVYLGEHWVSDIIGGSMLGIALGFISGGFMVGKINSKKSSDRVFEGSKH